MDFKERLREDATALMAKDLWAESVNVRFGSGPSRTIGAIIDRRESADLQQGNPGLERHLEATLIICTDAENGVVPDQVTSGLSIVFDEIEYRVRGRTWDDGAGLQSVEVISVAPFERSRDGYRRRI